jgi:two-component system LytT family sensor kinase
MRQFKLKQVTLSMRFSFSALSYKQKGNLAEIIFLFVIGVLSPFATGLQTFSWVSYRLSYMYVCILGLPAIILFYRLYLPYTFGKERYALALLLFPIYILVYELIDRLSMLITIASPFIPMGYRDGLKGAHPGDFSKGYFSFNEHFGYTIIVLMAATSLYVLKLLFKNQHNLFVLENEKLKMELVHLKSQVQPHFFFNTLNNMYTLSVQNSPQTPVMITDLSAIMRYVLYDTRNEKVPLSHEVEFINSYIRLENLRHTQSNLIDFSVQGNIDNTEIEPLLFLPLIENTFKHALHQDIPDKWVKLVLAVDEDELIFQTSNPKYSIRQIDNKLQNGIGLTNVKKRIELLYPNRHEFVIHDEDECFTVTLVIFLR